MCRYKSPVFLALGLALFLIQTASAWGPVIAVVSNASGIHTNSDMSAIVRARYPAGVESRSSVTQRFRELQELQTARREEAVLECTSLLALVVLVLALVFLRRKRSRILEMQKELAEWRRSQVDSGGRPHAMHSH